MANEELINHILEELNEAGRTIVAKSTIGEVKAELLDQKNPPTLKVSKQSRISKRIFCTVQVIMDRNNSAIWQIQMTRPMADYAPMEKIIVNAVSERPIFRGVKISYL